VAKHQNRLDSSYIQLVHILQQDFHSFQWSIVFIAMSGSALGRAVLSSGLLDDLNKVLEKAVEGMGLFSVVLVFACISLVVATL
jgi:phosphate transporter